MLLWVKGLAEGCRPNPVARLQAAPDAVLYSLKFGSGAHLSRQQMELAKEVALRPSSDEVTIECLVERWMQEPTLEDFANAVAKAFIPGRRSAPVE